MAPGIPMSTSMRLLDMDPADPKVAARLRAQSPIAHAAELERPVLLLAGGDDERVPIRSVLHYAAALQSHGKDVSLFVDADARHSVADPRTREALPVSHRTNVASPIGRRFTRSAGCGAARDAGQTDAVEGQRLPRLSRTVNPR
jgi:dienelactone hydrolase